jgi:hypothetical protein
LIVVWSPRFGPEAAAGWADGNGPPGSQKVMSGVPLATMAGSKVDWRVRHSAWVAAVVMLSPDHAKGMRRPAGVHPGHDPFIW